MLVNSKLFFLIAIVICFTCLNPFVPYHVTSFFIIIISGIFLLLWHCLTTIIYFTLSYSQKSELFQIFCISALSKILQLFVLLKVLWTSLCTRLFPQQAEAFDWATPLSHPTHSFSNSLKQKQKSTNKQKPLKTE